MELEKTDVLPCPFCGGEAFNETFSVRKGFEANVHCNSCLAMVYTITYDSYEKAKQEAIEAWNRRAAEARPKGEWVDGEYGIKCSVCEKYKDQDYDCFCAYCGADMRGD